MICSLYLQKTGMYNILKTGFYDFPDHKLRFPNELKIISKISGKTKYRVVYGARILLIDNKNETVLLNRGNIRCRNPTSIASENFSIGI